MQCHPIIGTIYKGAGFHLGISSWGGSSHITWPSWQGDILGGEGGGGGEVGSVWKGGGGGGEVELFGGEASPAPPPPPPPR